MDIRKLAAARQRREALEKPAQIEAIFEELKLRLEGVLTSQQQAAGVTRYVPVPPKMHP